ncbi:hypothetical protein CMK22_15085 [Candidatus Poribacteria bacterium]|nr:hypothetical protein [Candidatus Poribacteria bacterium]
MKLLSTKVPIPTLKKNPRGKLKTSREKEHRLNQKASNLKKTGKTSNFQAQHLQINHSEYIINTVVFFFSQLIIRYHTYQKHI